MIFAALMLPMWVLTGYAIDLNFDRFEVMAVGVAVIVANLLVETVDRTGWKE